MRIGVSPFMQLFWVSANAVLRDALTLSLSSSGLLDGLGSKSR